MVADTASFQSYARGLWSLVISFYFHFIGSHWRRDTKTVCLSGWLAGCLSRSLQLDSRVISVTVIGICQEEEEEEGGGKEEKKEVCTLADGTFQASNCSNAKASKIANHFGSSKCPSLVEAAAAAARLRLFGRYRKMGFIQLDCCCCGSS